MAGVRRCMLVVLVLMCVSVWVSTAARSRPRPQARRKIQKVNQIDQMQPVPNLDIQQMTGSWYLINTASKCPYLIKHGLKVEPTTMTLTFQGQTLAVSTKTRYNHDCWEILQEYQITETPGRLKLTGARPELNIDIVVRETDYSSYAIIFYQKRDKLTMKLYTRSTDDLPEPILDKFEELAEKERFGLAYIFPFPTYSHCDAVDQDHIIRCIPTC